jgi:hypothetical protein
MSQPSKISQYDLIHSKNEWLMKSSDYISNKPQYNDYQIKRHLEDGEFEKSFEGHLRRIKNRGIKQGLDPEFYAEQTLHNWFVDSGTGFNDYTRRGLSHRETSDFVFKILGERRQQKLDKAQVRWKLQEKLKEQKKAEEIATRNAKRNAKRRAKKNKNKNKNKDAGDE